MNTRIEVLNLDDVVSRWRARKIAQWLALPRGKRLYVAGVMGFLGSFVMLLLRMPPPTVLAAFLASGAACAVPLTGEIYAWLEKRRDTLGFKVISGVSTVMAGAVAAGVSSAYVSGATGQEPGSFKLAVALLAPLAFVPVFALVLMVVGTLSIFALLILALGADATGVAKKRIQLGWSLARLLGLATLVGIAGAVANHASELGDRLQFLGAYSAFLLDMQVNSACAPISSDRVTRINDELVIVGRQTAQGIVFVRRACPVRAQTNELPPPRPLAKR